MHGKRPLAIKGTLVSQSAQPKKLGFRLPLRLLKYFHAASSCQFAVLRPFAFLPFTYFSCLLPLLHPKLPHKLPAAESAEAALYLQFSLYPAMSAHTHFQRALLRTAKLQAHPYFCHRRQTCSRKLGQITVNVNSPSSNFVWWASATARFERRVLLRPMASIHEMRNRLWKMNACSLLHSKLALLLPSSFLTNPIKAFIPRVNKAEAEHEETGVQRVT